MKKSLAALALVVGLALTGCATPTAGSSGPEPDETASAAPRPAGEPSFAPTPEVEEPDPKDMLLNFGEAMTWVDGVSLSVSTAVAFTPTEHASGNDQAHQLLFTLVITNNSAEVLDPTVYSRVSSGGVEASSIYDYRNPVGDVSSPPRTAILPGQTVQWLEAYSIADPNSVTFQVAPSFEYQDAIFTNIPQ